LTEIQTIVDLGCLKEIDIHFASMMCRLSGQDTPELYLAAALASRSTTEGNVCLDLSSLAGGPVCQDPAGDGPTIHCPGLADWVRVLRNSPVIGRPGDYCPLILDEKNRLYLYRYRHYENTLTEALSLRAGAERVSSPEILSQMMARLFDPGDPSRTNWQKVAAYVAATRPFSVISGGPGTGKSSLIAKILVLCLAQSPDLRVALAAPTGKAAVRLQEAVERTRSSLPVEDALRDRIVPEAATLHRLLGTVPGSPYFRHHADHPLPLDLLVVDEASMVDLALMSKLFQALPGECRLILLGDRDQLASVEAGAVLGDICDRDRMHGFSPGLCRDYRKICGEPIQAPGESREGPKIQDCVVQLRKSFRFTSKSGIGWVSRAVNSANAECALEYLRSPEYPDITWQELPDRARLKPFLKSRILRGYRAYIRASDPLEALRAFERFRILCAVRTGPYGVEVLNRMSEEILEEEGLLRPDREWYRGRPIMISRNDYRLGLFNGDIGILLPDGEWDHQLRAFFLTPGGTLRRFLPARLPAHQSVYAVTVHKSQGSEFDRALLILPDSPLPVLTRELIYTGITRARHHVELWSSESVFREAVKRRIRRTSGLHDALWGPAS